MTEIEIKGKTFRTELARLLALCGLPQAKIPRQLADKLDKGFAYISTHNRRQPMDFGDIVNEISENGLECCFLDLADFSLQTILAYLNPLTRPFVEIVED